MFIIYINDIRNSLKLSNDNLLILFADDCNLFISADSTKEMFDQANAILSRLKSYIDANYLHINLSKSKYVTFRAPRVKSDPLLPDYENADPGVYFLKYDNTILKRVKSIKFLGIVVDETLDWSPHITLVNKKLNQISGVLYSLRKTATKSLLKSIEHMINCFSFESSVLM